MNHPNGDDDTDVPAEQLSTVEGVDEKLWNRWQKMKDTRERAEDVVKKIEEAYKILGLHSAGILTDLRWIVSDLNEFERDARQEYEDF